MAIIHISEVAGISKNCRPFSLVYEIGRDGFLACGACEACGYWDIFKLHIGFGLLATVLNGVIVNASDVNCKDRSIMNRYFDFISRLLHNIYVCIAYINNDVKISS
jgi:hypothetical protein